uniref:Uncharacterized protein n=1 Tax=Junco hyemalis TaxID=40217 RepID=A0A8C5J5X4_JUNHY
MGGCTEPPPPVSVWGEKRKGRDSSVSPQHLPSGLGSAELPTGSRESPWDAGLGWSCSSRSTTDPPSTAQVMPRHCPRFLLPGAGELCSSSSRVNL